MFLPKSLNNINIAEVKKIIVETSLKAKELDNRQPCSIEEAQYSFPFCIATALKCEKVTPDVMRDTDLIDPAIMDLCAKIYLQLDDFILDKRSFQYTQLSQIMPQDPPISATDIFTFVKILEKISDNSKEIKRKCPNYQVLLEPVDSSSESIHHSNIKNQNLAKNLGKIWKIKSVCY